MPAVPIRFHRGVDRGCRTQPERGVVPPPPSLSRSLRARQHHAQTAGRWNELLLLKSASDPVTTPPDGDLNAFDNAEVAPAFLDHFFAPSRNRSARRTSPSAVSKTRVAEGLPRFVPCEEWCSRRVNRGPLQPPSRGAEHHLHRCRQAVGKSFLECRARAIRRRWRRMTAAADDGVEFPAAFAAANRLRWRSSLCLITPLDEGENFPRLAHGRGSWDLFSRLGTPSRGIPPKSPPLEWDFIPDFFGLRVGQL